MTTALTHARVLTANGWRDDLAVLLDGERIAALLPHGHAIVRAAQAQDLAGALLVPGFIDTQVNGGGAAQYDGDGQSQAQRLRPALQPLAGRAERVGDDRADDHAEHHTGDSSQGGTARSRQRTGRIKLDRTFALRTLLAEVRFGDLSLARAMAAMAARIIGSGDGHESFPGGRVAQDAGSSRPWQAGQAWASSRFSPRLSSPHRNPAIPMSKA